MGQGSVPGIRNVVKESGPCGQSSNTSSIVNKMSVGTCLILDMWEANVKETEEKTNILFIIIYCTLNSLLDHISISRFSSVNTSFACVAETNVKLIS